MIDLQINNEPLEEKVYAKYLGVYIDQKLTWETQIEHINERLIKGNAILAKMRHYVSRKTVLNLYNSFIQPHLDYGALVWGQCAKTHIEKIEASQDKTIRILNFKKKDDSAKQLYPISKILPIKQNTKFILGKFIWRTVHSFQPTSILELFETHNAVPSDREPDKEFFKMRLPNQRIGHGINFVVFAGIKLWNQMIPNEIKKVCTANLYKKQLKDYFLNNIDD